MIVSLLRVDLRCMQVASGIVRRAPFDKYLDDIGLALSGWLSKECGRL